jgi:3-phosphoshikimate 1-carboxyvinyltransferase
MLTQLGVELLTDSEKGIGLRGGQVFDGFEMTIPGDISSAAFWMVLAAMIPGAEIQLKSVGVNPTSEWNLVSRCVI